VSSLKQLRAADRRLRRHIECHAEVVGAPGDGCAEQVALAVNAVPGLVCGLGCEIDRNVLGNMTVRVAR
jgi:hypothetical protein